MAYGDKCKRCGECCIDLFKRGGKYREALFETIRTAEKAVDGEITEEQMNIQFQAIQERLAA